MAIVSGNGAAVTGLGGPAGYGEIMLSRADDASLRVDMGAVFQNGFQFGATHVAADAVYVSTNGLVSFGAAVNGVQSNLAALNLPFIAAFHADIDTRLDGEGPESGPVWVDIDPGADVVSITWQEVGFYRRNASLTNTFQLQLYDQGENGIDIVLRYESVNWTTGDLQNGWNGLGGDAALIGWRFASAGSMVPHWASGNETRLLALADTLGNTGVAGLWSYHYQPPKVVNGSAANDVLLGDSGEDLLYGGSGDDRLRGLAGADALFGGSGFDLADYAQSATAVRVDLANPSANSGAEAAGDSYVSIEGVIGSAFDDGLYGDDGDNRLYGGAGNDILRGGTGNDSLFGGAGNDVFLAGSGAERYYGSDGYDLLDYRAATRGITLDLASAMARRITGIEAIAGSAFGDTLAGGIADDRLIGMGGNDILSGRRGADRLFGGTGNDRLTGGAGADVLNGGRGRDTASYTTAGAAIRADLARPDQNRGADALGDIYFSIENLSGSAFNDVLSGNSAANTLAGQAGNDRLIGGRGADLLLGGAGRDSASYRDARTAVCADLAHPDLNRGEARGDRFSQIEVLEGSAHSDHLAGDFRANALYGGAGHDVLMGRNGNDRLYGGSGQDIASYQDAPTGVFASLWRPAQNSGHASGDSYVSIEGLRGSAHADRLHGDGRANLLQGGGGADQLYGGGGDDRLQGGAGADRLYGGSGRDLASYAGAHSGVAAHLTAPRSNSGEARGDVYDSIEGLIGSSHDDSLSGGTAPDLLFGGAGQDVLYGGWGDDRLYGGAGDDTLKGGARADLLDGGAGLDWADYASDLSGLVADLANPAANTGDAAGDRYTAIEGLRGSYHNDRLYGDARANRLDGSSGRDRLFGRGGDDWLDGGAGADTLAGGAGADHFVIRNLSDAGDTVTDYAPDQGDSLDITLSGLSRADIGVRIETISGLGRPDTAEVVILHQPSGKTLFILTDAAGLSDIFVKIGATSYDLL